jgi:hypothetical protein
MAHFVGCPALKQTKTAHKFLMSHNPAGGEAQVQQLLDITLGLVARGHPQFVQPAVMLLK